MKDESGQGVGEGVPFERVRELALVLPEAEEGTSYGTPAFRVRGKLFARLREDGETLAVKVDLFERDALLAANPTLFFITDHYRAYPWMLIRLPVVDEETLMERLEQAHRLAAPAPRKRTPPPAPPRDGEG